MTFLKTALIQMTSGPTIAENLRVVEGLICEAAAQGAQLICTPENTDFMRGNLKDKLASALMEEDHPGLPLFSKLAQENEVWILAGSFGVKISEEKIANRSYLFDCKGDIVAKYDKVHLFDVDLPGGESYRESSVVEPGDSLALSETPWGVLGMSICYDVRFPHLYRSLSQRGAQILMVPAAFAVPTGKAHWEVLLRARAIENGAYVLAPGQCGTHEAGRQTYGHSLIINPWGEIIAQAGDTSDIIYADLDMDAVDKARAAIPAWRDNRDIPL